MTDLKERNQQRKISKACKSLLSPSHFNNGTSHRYRLVKRNRRAEQCKELREGVSPLILLYSIFYSIVTTHTDYTEYTNTCNHDQAHPHEACSICLVIETDIKN